MINLKRCFSYTFITIVLFSPCDVFAVWNFGSSTNAFDILLYDTTYRSESTPVIGKMSVLPFNNGYNILYSVSEVKTYAGTTCDSMILLDDQLYSPANNRQQEGIYQFILPNCTGNHPCGPWNITSNKLVAAFGPGMGCFRINFSDVKEATTGNVKITWDPISEQYIEMNPIDVKLAIPSF